MNSKKIVSMIGAAVVAASMALSSLPVCAAVTTMPDGGKFDAAYYAATYPDVVAALGTDANALYQHYKTCGAKEGRLPYAVGTATTVTITQAAKEPVLNASQKAILKEEVLNWYIKEDGLWGYNDPFDPSLVENYGTKYLLYKDAKNPLYAVADLDNDGVVEVYTNGGSGWGWTLWELKDVRHDTGTYWGSIYGYIPGQDLYYWEDGSGAGIDGLIDGYSMIQAMRYRYTDRTKQTLTVEDSDYNTVGTITTAELAAIKAQFTPIEQLLVVKPLTTASVNAIK